MQNYYVQSLLQWLIFFSTLLVFLYPAVSFQSIARKKNKNGWLYFFIGLGAGAVALTVAKLITSLLGRLEILQEYRSHLWIVLLLIGFATAFGSVISFRKSMDKKGTS